MAGLSPTNRHAVTSRHMCAGVTPPQAELASVTHTHTSPLRDVRVRDASAGWPSELGTALPKSTRHGVPSLETIR